MTAKTEVERLDQLVDELSAPAETQCELVREHIEGARAGLLGGIVEEYALNLRLASETLNCISDPERRQRVGTVLHDLLAGERLYPERA